MTGPGAEFIYTFMPDKSVARRLEARVINALDATGFPLRSKADGRHRSFGGAQEKVPEE